MSSDDVRERLDRLLRDLSTETVLLHQTVAERLGLNPTDHKCLGFLLDAGAPVTAGQLATMTGLTTGAVTGILDRLEQAGFVRRKRDANDRRQIFVEVNLDKVRREVFPIFDKLARRMSALAASYSRRELATITDFMEKGIAVSREYRSQL
jgi:DNA-binding MarR family transcriptional regulator